MVVIFSATAVIVAMLLGFLLSWSFLLPVRKMGRALSRIAGGSVKQHVDVHNRDEFGTLAHDLNDTSDRARQTVRRSAGPDGAPQRDE